MYNIRPLTPLTGTNNDANNTTSESEEGGNINKLIIRTIIMILRLASRNNRRDAINKRLKHVSSQLHIIYTKIMYVLPRTLAAPISKAGGRY